MGKERGQVSAFGLEMVAAPPPGRGLQGVTECSQDSGVPVPGAWCAQGLPKGQAQVWVPGLCLDLRVPPAWPAGL